MSSTDYISLPQLLDVRAASQPKDSAFVFLKNGEDEEIGIDYNTLWQRATGISLRLQECSKPFERVLLLCSPGIDYIAAFLGCLYARVIAVPTYPPQGKRSLPRLKSVADDASPTVAILDSWTQQRIDNMKVKPAFLNSLKVLVTDEIAPVSNFEEFGSPEVSSDDIAFLQYTSGSTGDPKGVLLTHANLLCIQRMISKAFVHSKSTRVCSWLPPYHDMGLIGTILQPLYLGIPGILMPPQAFLQKPVRWLAAISKFRATTSGAPNFAYDYCVDKIEEESMEYLDLSHWDLAFNGSEPVRPETMDRFAEKFAPCGFRRSAFFPCYGLAEATLIVAGGKKANEPRVQIFDKKDLEKNQARLVHSVEAGGHMLASCGWSIEQEIRIVDPDTLLPCPEGVAGEIWVRGENVAKGYWRKPDLTRETFDAQLKGEDRNAQSTQAWMRTGDLGFLKKGEIFITSRLKDLIIVRGRNHHPSDLERTAKNAHRSLRRGTSAAFSLEVEGVEQLVIVQEIERGQFFAAEVAAKAIREAVAEGHELAAHEILIVRPGTVPLTSSGKVQRRQCRHLYREGKLDDLTAVSHEANFLSKETDRLPASATEKRIAQIWSHQLKLDSVCASDNFFQLGGDSLAATQVTFSMQKVFGLELPLEILYENQSVESLAWNIDELNAPTKSNSSRAQSEDKVTFQSVPRTLSHTVDRRHEGKFPLSHQQRRVWFLSKLSPASADYHIPIALSLQGKLDPRALEKQLRLASARHDILRVAVEELNGEPNMKILDGQQISFEYCDLSILDEEQKLADYERSKAEIASSLFNLSKGPLWRARLIRIDDEEHRFLLTTHHLISDGWSIALWASEIFDALVNDTVQSGLTECSTCGWGYGEYVSWQQEQMATDAYRSRLDWWASLLKGSRPLHLARHDVDPPGSKSEPAACASTLPLEQLLQIKRLASENETTLFVVLLTAFKILLKRHSGKDAVNVGYPAANRAHPRSRYALGFYVNTLIARTTFSIDASSFIEALAETKSVVSGGLARQDVSFDDVLSKLQLSCSGSRNALFQVFFNLLSLPINEDMKEAAARGLTVELVEEPVWGSKFDLSLYARECESGLRLNLLFDATLFSGARVLEMLDQFCLLLRQIVENPRSAISSYTLLTEKTRQLPSICDEMPKLKLSSSFQPPFKLFEEQARRCHNAVAVLDGEEKWSYRELNERANRIAHSLIQRGIGTEDVVAIWAERTAWLACALLGIHKAGAAFAIFDPAHPVMRLQKCIQVAKPKLLLGLGDLGRIPHEIFSYASERDLDILDIRKIAIGLQDANHVGVLSYNPERNVDADDLAYLAFTSGTTGFPLCIEGTHGPLSHFLGWYADELSLVEATKDCPVRFSMLSGLAHDPLHRDIFVPLATGNTLWIPGQELFDQPSRLASWLSDSGIEVAHLTPALWELIASAADGLRLENLKFAVFSGDCLLEAHLQALRKRAPNVVAINGYGSTETPQLASFRRIDIRETVLATHTQPIGSRGGENRVLLLNGSGGQAAPGELAEICVESELLARAYRTLGGSEEIGERSGSEGLEKRRIYRTGDLGRYDLSGNIYFEKRKDHQVSIHGFRVELREIELAIQSHPQVIRCAALFLPVKGEQRSLVACYAVDRALKEDNLLAYLAERLPGYMLQARLVCLDTFPVNPNGKTDYARLRSLVLEKAPSTSRFEPRSEAETKLAAICSRILDVSEIDLDQTYSRLGGSSIDAVKVSLEIEREFGVQPRLTEFFQGRTLASLATWIENEAWLRGEGDHESAAPLGDEPSGRETILL